MGGFQVEITGELAIIGGAASTLVAILKALLLEVDRYPRLKALWPFLPPLFGVLLTLLFPSAVPSAKSVLVLGAHGAFSPLVFYILYPVFKAAIEAKTKAQLPSEGDNKQGG